MNICICGGGNLGHVCAGFLASEPENKVSLLTTRPDIWSRHIDIVAPEGKSIHGVLNCISNNPQDVIPDAQIVLLCLPGFAIREVLCTIAPCLSPNTWVGSVVSSTGFFFEAMKVHRQLRQAPEAAGGRRQARPRLGPRSLIHRFTRGRKYHHV